MGDVPYLKGSVPPETVAMATLAGQILADAIGGTMERFDVLSSVPSMRFPGGRALRWPLLVLAMSYYALRDRL